jgi:hypothetical protein
MFNNIKYLIYSSHKTSTQTLMSIFKANNIKVNFLHNMSNICVLYPKYDFHNDIGSGKRAGWGKYENIKSFKNLVLENFKEYNKVNNEKLSIISVRRNPKERLFSSLFQIYHTDEISYHQKLETETTIYNLNVNEIYNLYCEEIINNSLPGVIESVDELSFIFDIDIINNLEKKDNYYYFENNFIKLYVLEFKNTIDENNLEYLNTILNINLTINSSGNLSCHKSYYDKYKTVKPMITDEINNIIYERYNKFYFN